MYINIYIPKTGNRFITYHYLPRVIISELSLTRDCSFELANISINLLMTNRLLIIEFRIHNLAYG